MADIFGNLSIYLVNINEEKNLNISLENTLKVRELHEIPLYKIETIITDIYPISDKELIICTQNGIFIIQINP